MGVDLEFDIRQLEKTINKFNATQQELLDYKTKLETQLSTLKRQWNTPAGRAFFANQELTWKTEVSKYARTIKTMSDMLTAAKSNYQQVLDEANRLDF